jgi:hypothetical protein
MHQGWSGLFLWEFLLGYRRSVKNGDGTSGDGAENRQDQSETFTPFRTIQVSRMGSGAHGRANDRTYCYALPYTL